MARHVPKLNALLSHLLLSRRSCRRGVMAGLVPAIHAFLRLKVRKEDVDARDKRGHDGGGSQARQSLLWWHRQKISCRLIAQSGVADCQTGCGLQSPCERWWPSTYTREVSMGQTRKIPAEAVDLYTRFIHGEISRRDFLDGVERFAIAGLTATAIVEALMPNYALGQQVRKDDERIKASYETVPSPNGNGYI